MVPVMAGGIVLGGKTYSLVEYLQVVAITAGVVVFNFGGKKKKGGQADSPYGLGLIAFSLLMDAFTGGLQVFCPQHCRPAHTPRARPESVASPHRTPRTGQGQNEHQDAQPDG